MAVSPETLRLLTREAKRRDVRLQELLRAVIVPEWILTHLDANGIRVAPRKVDPQVTRASVNPLQVEPLLKASLSRATR